MKDKANSPKNANTLNKICKLKRDNISTRNSLILLKEKSVIITNHKRGKSPTGSVELTRKEFEKFIQWYQTAQPGGIKK